MKKKDKMLELYIRDEKLQNEPRWTLKWQI